MQPKSRDFLSNTNRNGAFTVLQETTRGKKTTQNNFIYGEFGRTDYQTKGYFIIIKYWLKLLILQRENILHIFAILCERIYAEGLKKCTTR